MSAPLSSASQPQVLSSTSLKPESLQTARTKIVRHWIKKNVPVAIAVGVLPILGLGAINFGAGRQIFSPKLQPQVEGAFVESNRSEALQAWSIYLLLSTGFVTVFAGGFTWLWLRVFVNALVKQSTQLVVQADQFQISESLQDLGYAIGRLQDQGSVDEILETAVVQVRALLKSDRTLVFVDGAETLTRQSEDHASGQTALLQSDLSALAVPIENLFQVPSGYVQVCSEVNGSDLPEQHQAVLAELGVQAQMVTQITLDNRSQGTLVVQCSQPRDWTDVEHQLFAAVAKQIAIALDRHATRESASAAAQDQVWSGHREHCLQLAQSSSVQVERVQHVMEHMQAGRDQNLRMEQGLKQIKDQIHDQQQADGETAIDRSISSITQMQETLVQAAHSSQQLVDLGATIGQTAGQMKELGDRINYQAMNASIAAKQRSDANDSWPLDFTNELLRLTRDLSRQASELDAVAAQVSAESKTVADSADMGGEQLLVSAEWFRDSRQQWNQMVAVNRQLESNLHRLMDSHQDRQKRDALSQEQMLELSHWLQQTVAESDAMAQSLEQLTARALA
ncbi:MAG: GAF domain-containing protein [Cyanobacteria bacterium P01_F01_bin.42]